MTRAHLFIALSVTLGTAGCSPAADEKAREAAADVREAASRAGDRLADGFLTARVQARYFADDKIKARYIDVSARDGVVTLNGYVENEDVRQHAVGIAQAVDGVSRVNDQLMIGQVPRPGAGEQPAPGAAATAGAAGTPQTPDTPAAALDDALITSLVQARYFVHDGIKGRRIDVDTRNGIVTLRGEVASDDERAAALLMARTTQGVQRVEDALTVNASLAPAADAPASPDPAPASPAPAPAGTGGVRTADERLTSAITARLTQDDLAGVTVTARDGVVLLEGAVRTQDQKQRALEAVRTTDGVKQVVDRLIVK